MIDDYIDRLKEWERDVADPVIYENIDILFPLYKFRRLRPSEGKKDRWVSSLKIDLSKPRHPSPEKTVVQPADLMFREQGEWSEGVSVKNKLMEDLGISNIYDMYRYVAELFNLDMPSPADSPSIGEGKKQFDRRQDLLRKLEEYFSWNLFNNNSPACTKTRLYLEKRGFSPVMISSLKFGFVPSWEKVEAYMTSPRMGFAVSEFNAACKVRNDNGYTSVGKDHVLAIPYRANGHIKGFLFRAVEPDVVPKYRANTGLERNKEFFNMPVKDKSVRALIVVEGEMDALIATASGIPNVVAIGGSDVSGERINMIKDAFSHNIKSFFFCLDLDVDKDGNPNYMKRFKANKRTLHSVFDVSPDFNKVFFTRLPYPSDPDEFIRKEGAKAFKDLVRQSQPWYQYLCDEVLTLQGKVLPPADDE